MQLYQALLLACALASPSIADDVCGTPGIALKIPYFTSRTKALNTAAACGTRCSADRKCKSYGVGAGLCLHYSSPVQQCFKKSSRGPIKFYDRICAPVKLTPPTSISSATGTSPDSTPTAGGVDIGGTITTPNVQTTDSPPLASSSVAFPTDDKSFTATYTYEDDPLPTIAAMGSFPLESGIQATESGLPHLPCMLDPSTTDQFNILGSNFAPLVSQSRGGLAPLPSPTSEAQAKSLGPASQLALPAFSFVKSANAPDGVYDIVLAGSTPQYLAKTSQGGLTLTSSSTGATQVRRNGQNIITSIFGVDCKGRITVTQASTSYVWDILGETTRFTAGTSEKRMVAYSLKRAATIDRSRVSRRNPWNEGQAPRCPASPPDLMARVFPGARGLAPNGCGAANGFDFVPDFSFGSCCDDHDNCYDDCTGGTWESCNRAFGRCMRTRGCDYLNNWYSFVPYASCLFAADFYELSVMTSIGRNAFYASNKDRCGCYCSAKAGLCGREGDGFTCTSMFGNDVNNCGACGRTCSAKAKCNLGSCACPNDQCGDRCVSLKTHPRNCGSCGNVCKSGYCFEGQCYDPPADKCVPGAAFTNGDFSTSGSWGTCQNTQQVGPNLPGVPKGTCSGRINDGKLKMSFNRISAADITTTAKVCPGQQYEFSFTLKPTRLIASSGGNCQFRYRFGEQDWSRYFDFSLDGDQRQGPFDAGAFQDGDFNGLVKKNGLSLDLPFQGTATCDGTAVEVSFDDFELVPRQ